MKKTLLAFFFKKIRRNYRGKRTVGGGGQTGSGGQKSCFFYPAAVLLFLSCFIVGVYPIRAQTPSPLPLITRLDTRDLVFRQYISDVETARRSLYTRNPLDRSAIERILSSLTIYSYVPGEGDGLLAIAARCNIPYSTVASLNRFSFIDDMPRGKVLLLSTVPGIFVPETPESGLESMLFSSRAESDEGLVRAVLLSIPREGKTERYWFLPGDDFTSTERIFFLDRGFQFPLRNFQISSAYGPRINPVTGRAGMHRGVDFAAPAGSEVYATRSGTIIDLGEDPVMGNYIMIRHENNWVSFYGHLSTINTVLYAEVQSASLIGRVGSTGQSTGPHLHFEIRQNGQDQDPVRLLGIFKGNQGR